MELHRPTRELVAQYGKQWDQMGPAEEDAIRELWKMFPDNRDYTGVLLKKKDGFSSGPMDLKDYRRFKEVLKEFLDYYKLGDLNAKELDRFLWGYGKEMFGPMMT
jgi:hypothetical protein